MDGGQSIEPPRLEGGWHHAPEWAPILSACRKLLPVLTERAQSTSEQRQISDETMSDLYDAKVLRHLQPKQYGGNGMPWGLQFHVARILAHACPSTAWIATVVATHVLYACRFSEEAREEIFAQGHDVLVGMGSVPIGVELAEEKDGYRVSGRFKFISGVDHVSWVILPIAQKMGDREGSFAVLVPREAFEIDDNWHVAGMKGTGSKDIVLTDVFVPAHRAMSLAEFWGERDSNITPDEDFIFSRNLEGYYGTGLIGPIIGMAEGGLKAYIEQTKKRIGAMSKDKVSENSAVQIRLAESAAEIKAARVLMETQFDFLRKCGERNLAISKEQVIEMNRDRSLATRMCIDALERLIRQMGALGIFENNPVQLFYRDLKAAATQIALNNDRNMVPAGRQLLGLDSSPAF